MFTKLKILFFLFAVFTLDNFAFNIIKNSYKSEISSEALENHKYYDFLKSAINADVDKEIKLLKNFLINNPQFEQIYLKILEWYIFQNKIDEAELFFQNLSSDSQFKHNSHWMLAKLYETLNLYEKAYKKYELCFSAKEPSILIIKDYITFHHKHQDKIKDKYDFINLIKNPDKQKFALALSKRKKSEYKNAIDLFLQISRSYSNHPEIIHNWGACLYFISQYAKADSIWSIGLQTTKKYRNADYQTQFLIDLAIIQDKQSNYIKALAYYDSANSIVLSTGSKYYLQLIKGNTANIYRHKIGDNTRAAKFYKEAIEISSKIEIPRITCTWYLGYAASIFSLGRFNEAFEAYEAAEEYALKAKNYLRVVTILLDKGSDYYYLRQTAVAKLTYLRALKIAKEKKIEYYQKYAKAKLGDILLSEGKYAKARENFNEFINYLDSHNRIIESYSWKARVARSYLNEKENTLAKKEYEEALQLAKKAQSKKYEGWCLLFLGDIDVSSSKIDIAIQKFNTVKEIAQKEKIYEMLWQVYLSLGNAYKKNNNVNIAILNYKKAIKVFERNLDNLSVDHLRVGYSSTGYNIYQKLIHCYYERYQISNKISDLDTLLFYEQISRGRSLNDLVINSKTNNYSELYLKTCNNINILQRKIRHKTVNHNIDEDFNKLYAKLNSEKYTLLVELLRSKNTSQNIQKFESYPKSLNFIQEKLKLTNLGLII